MSKTPSSASSSVFIDDIASAENDSLELEQQMIWVQIRKTVPGAWFMVAIAVWMTACFGYVWEAYALQTLTADINALWLLATGLLVPLIHYFTMGVLPFCSAHYGRNLSQPLENLPLPWRFYAWIFLALVLSASIWFGLWLFELSWVYRAMAYSLQTAAISSLLMAYRHHYQKSIQIEY